MTTPRKESIVEGLTEKLNRATGFVLVESQKMSMKEQLDMRKKLRAQGLEFQVAKNTLLRIATHNAGAANVDTFLNGPTGLIISYDEEVAAARAIVELVKTQKAIVIKAGVIGTTAFNAKQVEDLAKLPGKQELRSQAVGTIIGPLQQTHGLLSAPIRDLVQVLHNYAEKQGASF